MLLADAAGWHAQGAAAVVQLMQRSSHAAAPLHMRCKHGLPRQPARCNSCNAGGMRKRLVGSLHASATRRTAFQAVSAASCDAFASPYHAYHVRCVLHTAGQRCVQVARRQQRKGRTTPHAAAAAVLRGRRALLVLSLEARTLIVLRSLTPLALLITITAFPSHLLSHRFPHHHCSPLRHRSLLPSPCSLTIASL